MSGPDDLLSEPAVGFVLVGGASRRMGRDKACELVGGRTLAARAHAAVAEAVRSVTLVGKAGRENPLPGAAFTTDERPEHCALSGIVRALEVAAGRRALVTACDHPFLAPPLLRHLLDGPRDAAVRIPVVDGRLQPLVAVYRSSEALPVLAECLEAGRLGLRDALAGLTLETVPEEEVRAFDPGLLSFLNVNSVEDLERAREAEGN